MIPLSALRKLYISLKEHQVVEAEVARQLEGLLAPKYIKPQAKKHGMLHYAQRNFFSILFLSVYRALEIEKNHRIFYGVINHCLRGLVTGTDNLLDDEYKELLPLNFPAPAIRFKSVMHLLLFDRIMAGVIEDAVQKGLFSRQEAAKIHSELFRALVPIGAEEALEEGGVTEIISPADILSSIHMYKGGKLLCLAFVTPLLIEKQKLALLKKADEGIYSIGLALQVIDDLTDFYADIRDQRHNYLVSSIYFEGTAQEKEMLGKSLAARNMAGPPIETAYPDSVSRVMQRAIGEALHGFALLAEAGFWFDRRQAMGVIRYLFYLRGVKNLLAFLPDKDTISMTLRPHDG